MTKGTSHLFVFLSWIASLAFESWFPLTLERMFNSSWFLVWDPRTKSVYGDKATGKITNIQLLETMPIRDKKTGKITGYHDKSYKYGDRRNRRTTKQGTAKIGAVVKKLESNGYIIIHREIPGIEKIHLGGGRYGPDKPITVSQVMYEITSAGRRQAKDRMMDGKKWEKRKWVQQ